MEGPRCDVILEKLLIYEVDYCRDQLLDVFVAGQECFDIAWGNISICGVILGSVCGKNLLELKSRKLWRYLIRSSRFV